MLESRLVCDDNHSAVRTRDHEQIPKWNAHYTFTFDKGPKDPKIGWIAGKAQESDLILATDESYKDISLDKIWLCNAVFNFRPQTGAFCIESDSSSSGNADVAEITVNGRLVTSNGHDLNQHSMNVRIGPFEYLFEYTPFASSERYEQSRKEHLPAIWPTKIDDQFLMPAPMPQTRTMGPWTFNRPMGRGVFGKVYLASNSDSETVAVKMVLRKNRPESELELELRTEISNLKKLTQLAMDSNENGRIVRLKQILRLTDETDTDVMFGPFEEIGFVLEPFTPNTFEDIIAANKLYVMKTEIKSIPIVCLNMSDPNAGCSVNQQ